MERLVFSKNDIYPESSSTFTTTEQTIPDEVEIVADMTATATVGSQKVTVNKNMILGAILLLVGLMVALHFLGGE